MWWGRGKAVLLGLLLAACGGLAEKDDEGLSADVSDGTGGTGSARQKSYLQIACGESAVCVLGSNGSLECWGEAAVPEPRGSYVAVRMDDRMTCAVRADGHGGECWNEAGFYGSFPSEAGDLIPVDRRGQNVCWLKADGVECVGPGGLSVPIELPLTALAIAGDYACGLSTSGYPLCVDTTEFGWWVLTTTEKVPPPNVPLQDVATGSYGACGVSAEGDILCWGYFSEGVWPEACDIPPGRCFKRVEMQEVDICAVDDRGIWCESDAPREANLIPPTGVPSDYCVGHGFACGIFDDGLECWGDGYLLDSQPKDWIPDELRRP